MVLLDIRQKIHLRKQLELAIDKAFMPLLTNRSDQVNRGKIINLIVHRAHFQRIHALDKLQVGELVTLFESNQDLFEVFWLVPHHVDGLSKC